MFVNDCCSAYSATLPKDATRPPCGVHPTSLCPFMLLLCPITFSDFSRLISFPANQPTPLHQSHHVSPAITNKTLTHPAALTTPKTATCSFKPFSSNWKPRHSPTSFTSTILTHHTRHYSPCSPQPYNHNPLTHQVILGLYPYLLRLTAIVPSVLILRLVNSVQLLKVTAKLSNTKPITRTTYTPSTRTSH
jgi:hypothetical protein